jgi:hypothetical protein
MKWKSTNWLYLLGIGLPLALITAFGALLAWPRLLYALPVAALGVICMAALFRKVLFMPRALAEYGDLEPLDLPLPVYGDAGLFTSAAMNKYEFLCRTVEVLSPFRLSGKPPVAVINPGLASLGEDFIRIAAVRELRRYQGAYPVRAALRLLAPPLTAVALVMAAVYFELPVSEWLNPFLLQFAAPFLAMLLLLAHLYFWNRSLSAQDCTLDLFLTGVFPLEQVKRYIIASEEWERRYEKEKHSEFNRRSADTRITQLDRACNNEEDY